MKLKPPKIYTKSIPAPVGGLNARDALANMPATDAVKMDNVFPMPSEVKLRSGSVAHVTGLPDWVETLMKYNSSSANKLFAASDAGIYDVTTAGAVGAAVVTGLTNARWQHINFGVSSGQYLYCVNGADSPRIYNGTSWSIPSITGATASTFVNIHLFKHRIWFIQNNSFKAYYLPTDSIQGAVSLFDLAPLFQLGGYLMTMASWSISDTGGVDDYLAFISSEGEIALYRGTDPASASTWALVGMFRIGRPVGRRCTVRMGSDVVVICADGFFPLSKALLTNRNQLQLAISNKILNLVNEDVQKYSANFGWQPILYPTGNKLIINVPQYENSKQYQYVMNTITGAWCRFTGWNAACFEILTDKIYYGGNTTVYQCDTGYDDNGSAIVGDIKPAFSYFGLPGRNKKFTMVRPILKADGNITATLALNVDFNDKVPTTSPTFSGTGGSPWNTSPWNTTPWGGTNTIRKDWQTVTGIGFAATIRMRFSSSVFSISWQSTDYVFQVGGVI